MPLPKLLQSLMTLSLSKSSLSVAKTLVSDYITQSDSLATVAASRTASDHTAKFSNDSNPPTVEVQVHQSQTEKTSVHSNQAARTEASGDSGSYLDQVLDDDGKLLELLRLYPNAKLRKILHEDSTDPREQLHRVQAITERMGKRCLDLQNVLNGRVVSMPLETLLERGVITSPPELDKYGVRYRIAALRLRRERHKCADPSVGGEDEEERIDPDDGATNLTSRTQAELEDLSRCTSSSGVSVGSGITEHLAPSQPGYSREEFDFQDCLTLLLHDFDDSVFRDSYLPTAIDKWIASAARQGFKELAILDFAKEVQQCCLLALNTSQDPNPNFRDPQTCQLALDSMIPKLAERIDIEEEHFPISLFKRQEMIKRGMES